MAKTNDLASNKLKETARTKGINIHSVESDKKGGFKVDYFSFNSKKNIKTPDKTVYFQSLTEVEIWINNIL